MKYVARVLCWFIGHRPELWRKAEPGIGFDRVCRRCAKVNPVGSLLGAVRPVDRAAEIQDRARREPVQPWPISGG